MADNLEEAESHLERAARTIVDGPVKDALEKARAAVKEGKGQLLHQQKLIKVADRSELGWAVVVEYEVDELTKNPDNEHRLENAKIAAERKMLVRKRKLDAAAKQKRVVPAPEERLERERVSIFCGGACSEDASATTREAKWAAGMLWLWRKRSF